MAERPFETRTVTAQVEYRDDAEGPTIIGHAATFNQPYQVGYFTETIHPDAFKRTLAGNPDVRLLVDHEGTPLARTKSGTLQLGTDAHGLTVRAALDMSNPKAAELVSAMKRGDIDQMSFAFRVPKGGDEWDDSMSQRTIREASLSGGDVSVVTYPANENATVALRHRESREAHAVLAHAFIDALLEGRAIDTGRLTRVLHALAAADANLDGSLAAVADMLGVTNPDEAQDAHADPKGIRAAMATADINDLPDSDFAYIEPGGEKDSEGKTTPRSLRHFPIHDAAHVRNALARASQSPFGAKAMPKIKAAAAKFGIDVSEQNSAGIDLEVARYLVEQARKKRA